MFIGDKFLKTVIFFDNVPVLAKPINYIETTKPPIEE